MNYGTSTDISVKLLLWLKLHECQTQEIRSLPPAKLESKAQIELLTKYLKDVHGLYNYRSLVIQ